MRNWIEFRGILYNLSCYDTIYINIYDQIVMTHGVYDKENTIIECDSKAVAKALMDKIGMRLEA